MTKKEESKVCLSLYKGRAYGRDNYYPACTNSELILSFMKNRVAFDADEVELMHGAGWFLTINDDMLRAKK